MFLSLSRLNMAAFFRIARYPKSSSNSLFQLVGINRHAPTISRLYTRGVGTPRLGFCVRQTGLNVNSTSLHFMSCRHFGVPLQKNNMNSVFHLNTASESNVPIDRAMYMYQDALMKAFIGITQSGTPTAAQSLLLIKSCGSVLAGSPMAERTKLVQDFWKKLQELGVKFDVTHYNELLRTHTENEFQICPIAFLEEMEAANVHPNRVTYQRLIALYCNAGDINGASRVLSVMKNQNLPITEAVFSSLVVGHARAGDILSAEGVLEVMKEAGVTPGCDTYVSLINMYAEKGDIDKTLQTIDALRFSSPSSKNKELMKVIVSLARCGHTDHVSAILPHLSNSRYLYQEMKAACLNLIVHGQEMTALSLLKKVRDLYMTTSMDFSKFFLHQCVTMETSVGKLKELVKAFPNDDSLPTWLHYALRLALSNNQTGYGLELIKALKAEGLPVRHHFFWPLLTQYRKNKNFAGIVEVVKVMQEYGLKLSVSDLPYFQDAFSSLEHACDYFKESGIDVTFLQEKSPYEVGNLAELYTQMSSSGVADFRGFKDLIKCFRRFEDVESMANIIELFMQEEDRKDKLMFLAKVFSKFLREEFELKEKQIKQFFRLLTEKGIQLPENTLADIFIRCPRLQKTLTSYPVPHGEPEMQSKAIDPSEVVKIVEMFKDKKEKLQMYIRTTIATLCRDGQIEHAMKIKSEYSPELIPGDYALLINGCCQKEDLEQALKLKEEMFQHFPDSVLDLSKSLSMVELLGKHSRVEG
ncbi:hypothetical protein DNTS_024582 [Danionella cerebrum]|uniref:PROP1-like PPR domain-containing protein n=1 Tax=Danionella cerebrum TaxID=2873325 RepID=A0A553NHJ0_9TELE|nr:hypothetical protein DNTS_024582 [Danionella translucida]